MMLTYEDGIHFHRATVSSLVDQVLTMMQRFAADGPCL